MDSLESLFSLRGRVGFVTGASSGLGVDCAIALAMAGADVAHEARQAALARAARTSGRHPGRLRTSTARLLLGLARRLDHRLGQVDEQPPLTAMAR